MVLVWLMLLCFVILTKYLPGFYSYQNGTIFDVYSENPLVKNMDYNLDMTLSSFFSRVIFKFVEKDFKVALKCREERS